jgi:hypothetical protein
MTTISKRFSARRTRIVLLFLLGNAALWVVFWGGFFSESKAYPRLQVPMEGAYVSQVVANRAVSPDLYPGQEVSYRVSFIPNFPSFIVVRILFNLCLGGYRSPALHFGTTSGGYELICWMIFSFLQWSLIGSAVGWLMTRKLGRVVALAQ